MRVCGVRGSPPPAARAGCRSQRLRSARGPRSGRTGFTGSVCVSSEGFSRRGAPGRGHGAWPGVHYRYSPTGNLPATARCFTSERAMTPLVLPTRESDVLVRSLLPRGLLTKHGASHEPVGDQIWGRHEHVAEGDQISHREMV